MNRIVCLVVGALIACGASAEELHNAAQISYGATASFSGAPVNRQWPAKGAIPNEDPKNQRGGCLFGAPMEGGTIKVNLLKPLTIARLDLQQLDYRGTMNVKTAEIAVDGKLVKTVTLKEMPGKFQEVPLDDINGTMVSVKCVETFPPMTLKGGKKGPNYGGWGRVRVMVREDVGAMMATPSCYKVERIADACLPPQIGKSGKNGPRVIGKPRVAQGHPRTTWDAQDVAEFRARLKTDPEFKRMALALKASLDQRMRKPLRVPQPLGKDEKGAWKHLPDQQYGRTHNQLGLTVADCGTIYQLFGEEKYAAFGRSILLDYAQAFPKYGVGARPSFRHDPSILFDQRLGDATALIQFAVGYDFLREAPCFTAQDRQQIEENFILADARHIRANRALVSAPTNWSAIGAAACLAAGVACENQDMINTALWGHRWSMRRGADAKKTELNRWWEGDLADKPSGMELHFSPQCIGSDGMWAEGAMGYQFMAIQAIVFDAEVMWRMGIDLYSRNNCAVKGLFDSPLLFSNPNLVSPAIHDSGNVSIVGYNAHVYETAYLRYRDPAYLQVVELISPRLAATFQQFTISTYWERGDKGAVAVERPSFDLTSVGFALLRVTDERGERDLLLDYGPNRSHGHPDKLNLDFWAIRERLLPDPGTAWYEQPIYRNWFRTTFAHNTISVDRQEQNACGAELLAFAPGESVGAMRARTAEAYPGVTMDRALVMTGDYVADLYGVFSSSKRLYDLAWHPRGKLVAEPSGVKAYALPEPRTPGYNMLENVRAVDAKAAQKLVYREKDFEYALMTAAAPVPSTLVLGEVTLSDKNAARVETAVFESRTTDNTVFGTVCDISGKVRQISQAGSPEEGYARLEIETAETRDFFWSFYRPVENPKATQVDTDGQLAYVSLDRKVPQRKRLQLHKMLMTGGKRLAYAGFSLTSSVVGGALAERTATGSYLIRNTSAQTAEITLTLEGKKFSRTLPSGETAEWCLNGAQPIAEHRKKMLAQLAHERAEAARQAEREKQALLKSRRAALAKNPGRAQTQVVVQAEDFVQEQEGNVRVLDTKTAAIGKSFFHWDAEGHTLTWEVEVPSDGCYYLTLCYCSDSARYRSIEVNGKAVAGAEEIPIPSSGGFSNGTDNWQLFTFKMTENEPLPIPFRAGKNKLSLKNVGGGGVNVDYLMVTSPDVKPVRLKN